MSCTAAVSWRRWASRILTLRKPFSLQETYEVKRNKFLEEFQKKEEEMRQIFIQNQREKSWKKKKKLNFKRQRKSCMTSLTV